MVNNKTPKTHTASAFGMPIYGRALGTAALASTCATASIAPMGQVRVEVKTKGAFPGSHAWRPPIS